MKMSLEDAKYCLQANMKDCLKCKFCGQTDIECEQEAKEIAITALNYLIIGKRLADEANEKER